MHRRGRKKPLALAGLDQTTEQAENAFDPAWEWKQLVRESQRDLKQIEDQVGESQENGNLHEQDYALEKPKGNNANQKDHANLLTKDYANPMKDPRETKQLHGIRVRKQRQVYFSPPEKQDYEKLKPDYANPKEDPLEKQEYADPKEDYAKSKQDYANSLEKLQRDYASPMAKSKQDYANPLENLRQDYASPLEKLKRDYADPEQDYANRKSLKKKSLQVHIISAQKLPKVHRWRKTRAYATAWVDTHGSNKLYTHIDSKGGRNPTWNEIFNFEVDAEKIVEELGSNAGITVEIYTPTWFGRRKLVGTVRVLITDLLQVIKGSKSKCFTFMIIRPSGLREGLLNIGVSPERYYESRQLG